MQECHLRAELVRQIGAEVAIDEREIDHQPAVGDRLAGDVVSAAADRDLEPGIPGCIDGVDDIGGVQSFSRDLRLKVQGFPAFRRDRPGVPLPT
jgi:hypothetical protein